MNEILSRFSFEGKFQYLTKYKDLDCWMKYQLDSALKESFNAKNKVWILYYKQSEETLLNIKI